jgi:hypothetical protein
MLEEADPVPQQPAIVAINEKAAKKPARRPRPAELPRKIETIAPKQVTRLFHVRGGLRAVKSYQ